MSKEEQNELNSKACELLQKYGISLPVRENVYELLRGNGLVGYANCYLQDCYDESELINKADVKIYKQLLEIDAKLGTTQSEQLSECVMLALRIDLIKV